MHKRITLLYDFDYTLCDGYMQQFGLMQEFGYDDVFKFFKANEGVLDDPDMDLCLSNMAGMIFGAREKGKNLTREYLQSFGKEIKYFPGVEDWFEKINKIGRDLGYEIEHYVISSGIKEIIEGTTIAKYLKRIYANFYAYRDGVAVWPSQVVNYSSKIQYIYRVRKNILDHLSDLNAVNEKMPVEDQLPFENIIYLGDSETDIPSFKVVKKGGGLSVCVYKEDSERARSIAEKCFSENRVNCFRKANYTEGSDLFNTIKDYIIALAERNLSR